MPSHVYTSPHLNFLFTPCDVHIQNEKGYTKCSFLTATVNFRNTDNNDEEAEVKRNYFLPYQTYTMQLHLNLAIPHQEQYGRMFVTCLTLLDYNQDPLTFIGTENHSEERCVSTTIFPKSVYAKFFDFLFRYPIQAVHNIFAQSSLSLGLAMATELSQWTKITFHHQYKDSSRYSAVKAVIKIKDVHVEPLQANFHIHESNLSLWKDPILYLMTNHSTITCVLTVLAISIPALILILMIWDRLTKPTVIKQAYSTDMKNDSNFSVSSSAEKSTNCTRYSPKFSVKTSDLFLRYDQARQRLKSAKIKSEHERQHQNHTQGDEPQILVGQTDPYKTKPKIDNNKNLQYKVNNSTDTNIPNQSSYLVDCSDKEDPRVGKDSNTKYIMEINTTKDDILMDLDKIKNERQKSICTMETLTQNDVKSHDLDHSLPNACLPLATNLVKADPIDHQYIERSEDCDTILRRRKETLKK